MNKLLIFLFLVFCAYSTNVSAERITYFHAAALGSPVAATDEGGNLKWTEHYKPFGERVNNSSEGSENNIGFTGHELDSDTGLTYMQARYYDPVIGRFYSNDPVGYTAKNPVMSFNRYLYVNNNPYKYTDPNGEFLLQAVGAIGGAILGVAAQAVADVASGNAPTMGKYLGAAAGGAVAGIVATTTFNPGAASAAAIAVQGSIAGAAGGATGNAIQQKVDTGTVDLGEVGVNALTGGTIGALVPGLKVPGITSGTGSFSAVAKTANTKLANGTISNVSNKTVAKAVSSDIVQGGGQAGTSAAALATCQGSGGC